MQRRRNQRHGYRLSRIAIAAFLSAASLAAIAPAADLPAADSCANGWPTFRNDLPGGAETPATLIADEPPAPIDREERASVPLPSPALSGALVLGAQWLAWMLARKQDI